MHLRFIKDLPKQLGGSFLLVPLFEAWAIAF